MSTTQINGNPNGTPSFDVFISYSHDDTWLAERLSRRIRRYRAPRALDIRRRRLRVFRDVERLTAHPKLGEALRERIDATAHLLLICSPSAAASGYVDQEVAAFIQKKGTSSITIILAAGIPEESFPPSLTAAYQEPLYIDLRPTGHWLSDWRHFRNGSLRVIAALFRVDFAELDREDQRRSLRLRWGSITAALTIAISLGCGYLIERVPADTWRSIPLPSSYFDSTLLPIVDYAAYNSDPDIRLFHGFGAEFAAQYPENPIGFSGGHYPEFITQVKHFLQTEKDFDRLSGPLAVLHFDLVSEQTENSNTPSRERAGELRIHGHREKPGSPVLFSGSLRYEEPEGGAKTLLFPPTRMNSKNPLGLEPWPSSVLNAAEVLPYQGYLVGSLKTAWGDREEPVIYELIDLDESFWEGNDGQWIQEGVFTDGDDERQVTIAGAVQDMQDIDPEFWPMVIKDPGWSTYRPPDRDYVEELMVHRMSNGELYVGPQGVGVDSGLIGFIENIPDRDPEYLYRVSHIREQSSAPGIEMARIIIQRYDEMAKRKEAYADYTLLRRKPGASWLSIEGIDWDRSTDIIDIFTLGPNASTILVLTDREGFYRSSDGGSTWTEFNHGEALLMNSERLRPVVTGQPGGIYTLVITTSSNQYKGNNLLFRHARRSWHERLRQALIGLFSNLLAD